MHDNALRMQDSCAGTLMAQLPIEKFEEAVVKAVKLTNALFLLTNQVHRYIFVRYFLVVDRR